MTRQKELDIFWLTEKESMADPKKVKMTVKESESLTD